MLRRLTGLFLLLSVSGLAIAGDLPPFPKQLPPVMATAKLIDAGKGDATSSWKVGVSIPRIHWEIAGEIDPKKEWPQLKTEVENVSLVLEMGGPSQLAESRFLDMKGNSLDREQVIKRLASETPVLVSLSGDMPDAYYLQLTSSEALLIVLGPRDGYPAPEFLPAKKNVATAAEVDRDH